MAKIQDKSIFGEYKQLENRVTAAFLHILQVGGENIIRFVFRDKGVDIPDNDISISTQVSNAKGIADGKIQCRFCFDIQIESKIKGGIDENQLKRYKQLRNTSNVQLVYIIPNKVSNINALKGIPYFTWNELDAVLDNYLSEYDEWVGDVERFLIGQFKLLLENNNLIDKSKDRVIVVGGAFGEQVAKKYKFYACQNYRYFKDAKYLAFYHKKAISSLFKIEDGYPVNDADLRDVALGIPDEYFENYEPMYNQNDRREVFKLSEEIQLPDTIKHVVSNRKFYAYVQKQKYVSYASLIKANTTAELEPCN